VVSSDDRRLLRRTLSGGLSVHAELADVCGGPANELVLDRRGRAYVGELGFDVFANAPASTANLLRVDPDGAVSIVADELLFPNGSAITPDGGTLLICESFGGRIAAFSILGDGSLTDRRAWGVMGAAVDPSADDWGPLLERQFSPDGMTLDAEGHVWVCDPANARCARLAPGGRVVAELAMPDGVTAFGCVLGSADGRTLLVTAAPHEPQGRPDSVVLTARVAVPGVQPAARLAYMSWDPAFHAQATARHVEDRRGVERGITFDRRSPLASGPCVPSDVGPPREPGERLRQRRRRS
jgi:sugar lactone lactonase YvrE